jgi:hypothetical protein
MQGGGSNYWSVLAFIILVYPGDNFKGVVYEYRLGICWNEVLD